MSSYTSQATNPFALAQHYTQISFTTGKVPANQAEAYFDDIALSVSVFEIDEAEGIWKVDVVTDAKLEDADITRRLQLLADAAGAGVPKFESIEVEPEMWQHNLHDFPPLHIGRYLIHGSHIKPERAGGIYPICVDAGMAFGSGEHATTEGCLKLFDDYMNMAVVKPKRVLDMGCGSAILAMAAANRLPNSRIIGVDIDEVSVQVAKENAKLNGVSQQLKLYIGNGYQSRAVLQDTPYDVIFANILARPLMSMAKDLSNALDEQGVAILSGLLNSQEAMVLAAHRLVGLHLVQRWHKDGWSALMLRKS